MDTKFFYTEGTGQNRLITLTDDYFHLVEEENTEELLNEAEARWNLVETAWELGIAPGLLKTEMVGDEYKLVVKEEGNKRKDVTTAREALAGYQKAKCFYCYGGITTLRGLDNSSDVDHFIPHKFQNKTTINLDGVFNLVLAGPICNRGEGGKFSRIPNEKYLYRLDKRNNFLISSNHPIKETLILQTGRTENKRWEFLSNLYSFARNLTKEIPWEIEERGEAVF
jgi:hypothetical protein